MTGAATPTAAPLDLSARFDAEAAWAALHEPMRTAIGAAVLSGLVGRDLVAYGASAGDERYTRLGVAAEAQAERELDMLLDEVAVPGLDLPSGPPRVPAILGMVCERCGCTEFDPCPSGCGWARENLCTACAPAAPAAPAVG